MFVFDTQGTLIGNPVLSDEDVRRALFLLKSQGHKIHIWSGDQASIPKNLADLADSVSAKTLTDAPFDWNEVKTVVDDDAQYLRACAHHARHMHQHTVGTLSAEQFALWIVDSSTEHAQKQRVAEMREEERKKRVFDITGVECSCDNNIAEHPCPYTEEIEGHSKDMCTCCAACTAACAEQV